jgi:cytochrome c556
MLRKWLVLGVAMVSVMGLTVGIVVAQDEDSPLHKLMEQVNKTSNDIGKGVRTAISYKKAQKDVAKHSTELASLAKQVHDGQGEGVGAAIKEVIKKATKEVPDAKTKWDGLMTSFGSTTADLAKVAAKANATQVEVKSAHTAVKKVCTECHNVFRIEEE